MFFKVHPYSSFTPSNKHNLVTGHLSLSIAPFARTSTVLINPSAPGNKFSTHPKAHWFLATDVSDMKVPFFLLPLGSLLQSWYVLFKPVSPIVISQQLCLLPPFFLRWSASSGESLQAYPCQCIPSSPHGISARDPVSRDSPFQAALSPLCFTMVVG